MIDIKCHVDKVYNSRFEVICNGETTLLSLIPEVEDIQKFWTNHTSKTLMKDFAKKNNT